MYGQNSFDPTEEDEYKFDYDMDVNPATNFQQQQFGKPNAFGQSTIQPPPSSLGRGPPGTQARGIPGSRMMTSHGQGEVRPMTSVKGAGYQSKPSSNKSNGFDPLNQGSRGPAPALVSNSEGSPEQRAKEMEKQVNRLIEQSADARVRKEFMPALEKAKEAEKKERQLCKFREKNGLVDQINLELTYSMNFNLANCYHLNEMYAEALSTYSYIVKNKQYPQSGRLRVNMGNIYFEQKKYPNAIKMFRMALDQISNNAKEVRYRIMRNIGIAFIKLGQFQDAIQSFEAIMEGNPDHQTGFNLIVCYFALGDTEKMKKGFIDLISIPVESVIEEEEDMEFESKENKENGAALRDVDTLKIELKEREKIARTFIQNAAKLIAPALDRKNWVNGYDWVVESLNQDHSLIASEMEIVKAIAYLRNKKFDKAIEVLKAFEKKEQSLKAKAATNLSFLYFLEGDINSADKYANLAVKNDRYNAKALVNKGNCLMMQGELERAKELYLEAIGVEADCSEAIFNLGLVNKKLNKPHEALQAFEKLHSIIPNSPDVIFHIANLCDQLQNYRAATKWFNILATRTPTDPGVLSRLGQMFDKEGDESQAFHYHYESYRYYPVNLDVISWLGVWYVKSELYERAIEFFDRASQIQPQEVKWRLMVTSCYRRMGSYQKALQLYEEIHRDYPENLECLRYLVAICKDLGMKYDQYKTALSKLERSTLSTRAGGDGQLTQAAGGAAPIGGGGGANFADPRPKDKFVGMQAIGEAEGDNEEEDSMEISNGRRSSHHNIEHSIGEKGRMIKSKKVDESDDWGDADLDDLLAD